MNDKFKNIFGNYTDKQKSEFKKEHEERLKRQRKSLLHCKIPDWTEQGGMVEFWINKDNTFESMDSRFDNERIKQGIEIFYKNWVLNK
jgi:hypothetical protein